MKKFFYFVATILIIALLYAIWQFSQPASKQQKENTTPSEIISTTDNCTCKSECICPEDNLDCDCNQTKSICECTQKDGQIKIIETLETNNVDIEETNPDETSDEDETIVSE